MLELETSKDTEAASALESTILIPENPENQGRLEQEQTNLKILLFTLIYLAEVGTWHNLVWRSEGNLQVSVSSLLSDIGLRDITRLLSLAKGLYWISHPTGPTADF